MLPEVMIMKKCIMHHTEQDRMFSLKHWLVTVTNGNDGIMMPDGILMKICPVHNIQIQPIGTCECAQCGCIIHMHSSSKQNPNVFMSSSMTDLYCTHCADKNDVPLQMNIYHGDLDEMQRHMPSKTIYQLLFKDESSYQKEIIQYYSDLGFVYVNNKNAKELYHDMLARRVIRRWKEKVLQKHLFQRNVASVLYSYGGVGLDAALVLSSRVC